MEEIYEIQTMNGVQPVCDKSARAQIEGLTELTSGFTQYSLEVSSNPVFQRRSNPFVYEKYASQMGGYLFFVKNGAVYAAKMNPSWTAFADGTPITAAIRQATETMIHVPDCYYLGLDPSKDPVDNPTMKFGGLFPFDGAHKFASPHWVGAYQMSSGGHSRPGSGSAHSNTMSGFWNLAQAIHTDFGLANYQFHCLINALYQAAYGNLNSEDFLSNGNSRESGGWDSYRDLAHGQADSLGNGTGCVQVTDGGGYTRYVTKLFGFEDLFRKIWEFRPGIRFYMDGDVRHAVIYDGNQVSNSAAGRDISGVLASASGQYTTAMELGEYWDMLPKAVGGGSDTYYCDGCWADTGGELLLVGGHAGNGSQCGLSFSYSSNGFSNSYADVGARLAFYSEPAIMTGAQLVAMMA